MRATIFRALLPLLAVGLVLLGLIVVRQATRQWLRQQERATIAFADLDCPVPAGLERELFLLEVQSLGGLPDRLALLDDDLAARLADAFGHHPWVEKVERVTVLPRQVEVRLAFRTPVLAVSLPEETRVVDARGVLLPPHTAYEGLPQLRGSAPLPKGLSGTPWGDAGIEAVARTAGFLGKHGAELHLVAMEVIPGGVVVWYTAAGTRIVWGHEPGAEIDDEVHAAQKLERLLRSGDLDQLAGLDVRRAG